MKDKNNKKKLIRNLNRWRKDRYKDKIEQVTDSFQKPGEEIIMPFLSDIDKTSLISNLKNSQGYYWNREYSSLAYDLYNLFYTSYSRIQFVKKTSENKNRFDFIFFVNASNIKILTKEHAIYSYIVVREIIGSLVSRFGSTTAILNSFGDFPTSNAVKRSVRESIENSIDLIETIESMHGFGKSNGEDISDPEFKSQLDLYEYYSKVTVDANILMKFSSKIGKLTTNYFSANSTQKELPITEASMFDEMEGVEHFLPSLDNFLFEHLTTTEREYKTGFDIYIDYSSSMTYSFMDQPINRLDLCKIVALKLIEENLIQDRYIFNANVSKLDSIKLLIKLIPKGSTSIENVIENVIETDRSALVLTDLESSILTYSPDVFFISFEDYRNFKSTIAGQKYLANKQCVYFNGEDFHIITSEVDKR